MGKPAGRIGGMVLQDAPHCHAPIHPAAPVPTPVPHPALPLPIIMGAPTVLIGGPGRKNTCPGVAFSSLSVCFVTNCLIYERSVKRVPAFYMDNSTRTSGYLY